MKKITIIKPTTVLLIIAVIVSFVLFNYIFSFDSVLFESSGGKVSEASSLDYKQYVRFIKNNDETLLKETGYIGSLVKENLDGTLCFKDLYTVCADNNELSTKNLTLEKVDYSNVEEEMVNFLNETTDNKKIENFCQSIVFINYNSLNRGKIDLKVTKTYVDGSGGLAPYVNIWDIKSTMIVTTYIAGGRSHYIKEVAPLFVIGEDIINLSPVYTNANNATITLSEGTSHTVQIQAGIEYDGIVHPEIGGSYTFEYGETKSYSFVAGSFSEIQTSNLYWDIWGSRYDGVRYKSTPNASNATVMTHEMVQRVAYYDNDNTPDLLSAFVGIAGIKISDSMGTRFEIGYGSNGTIEDDSLAFVIGIGWNADNSEHSYMANLIGYGSLLMSESHSNLPEDVWSHSYSYGG